MKGKTIFYIVALIVLIVIVIVGLALLEKVSPKENQSPNTQATTTENAPFSNTTEEGYSLYTNNKYGFSIMYPTSLAKVDPQAVTGLTDDLDASDIFVGEIPKDTFKGTNLYEVHIIAGAKATDENTCKYFLNGNDVRIFQPKQTPQNITINGNNFTKINVFNAGAGNVYQTTRYSTYKNGTCYELLAVAHSGNFSLLQETNPNVKPYDDTMFMIEFEEIVSFFKFIN